MRDQSSLLNIYIVSLSNNPSEGITPLKLKLRYNYIRIQVIEDCIFVAHMQTHSKYIYIISMVVSLCSCPARFSFQELLEASIALQG